MIHPKVEEAFQEIDAACFSGDDLEITDFRERLEYFVERWQKRLDGTAYMSEAKCKTCKAWGARLGITVDNECLNCRETRRLQTIVLKVMPRSRAQIRRMVSLLPDV